MNEKMSFEEFKGVVMDQIRKYLPEDFRDISLQIVTKTNDVKLNGLMIRQVNSNVCPMIYLESFYKDYTKGEDVEEVIKKIVKARMTHDKPDGVDVNEISNYDYCKDKIRPRLINAEWNQELLKTRPHFDVADLAAIFIVNLGSNGEGTMSVQVTDGLMQIWGVSKEDILRIAKENIAKEGSFATMSSVLGELVGVDMHDEFEDRMYVLSNKSKINGSSIILSDEVMNKVIEKIGSDFYILPSSIHELLIVPDRAEIMLSELENMVRYVNATQVEEHDRLSDHVYRYTQQEGLKIA